ncbi:RDD family protein [Streptomyces sp. NPDC091272]|uniref:RDD family protein n=1 Tax=Streptomyces sp. NPDC091272 TaxID=3365981 RepID=UPI00380DE7D2
MTTDQPPPGVPPENDPFRKYPPPPPPQGGGAGNPYDRPPGDTGGSLPPYGGGPYGGDGGPGGGHGGFGGGYGGGPGADPLSGMPPLASLGKRFLARFLDLLIVGIPLAIIGIPFGTYERINKTTDDLGDTITQVSTGKSMVFQLISILVYLAYDTYLTKKNGQTLGKRIMGLRVAMLNDGSTPQTNSALVRAAVLLLPALICCPCLWWLITLVMIAVDKPYKQGLHDKAAKTVVVTVAP